MTFLEHVIIGDRDLNYFQIIDAQEDVYPQFTIKMQHCSKLEFKHNKNLIDLLSSFKMSMLYQQVVHIESTRADAVMNEIKVNGNKHIPFNFIKETLPYYHIVNIDFLEDTSDGSSTTHVLNCIAFQPHIAKSLDIIEPDFPKHCSTKRLQLNIFVNLANCIKPSKDDFQKKSTHEKNLLIVSTDIDVKYWAIGKYMEFLYTSYEITL